MNKNYLNRHKLSGATAAGWMIIIAVVLFFIYVAIKLIPAYIEYSNVKSVMTAVQQERLANASKKEIGDKFEYKLSFADIDFMNKDHYMVIENKEGKFLDVKYDKKIPMFGNVNVLIEFAHNQPLQ